MHLNQNGWRQTSWIFLHGWEWGSIAHLLILIKKGGLLQLKCVALASALTFTFGRDNLSFSCILSKFVMHVTNDQFSDKFNNGQKKFKMADLLQFSYFRSMIWPCGHDNLKSFSYILFKFVVHVTKKQFSDKFNNGWKKIQNGRFTAIYRILRQ